MAESGDLTAAPAGDVAGLVRAFAADPSRHVPVPGTHNFRDVGGYPAEGGTIRWRKLFRSDALLRADEQPGYDVYPDGPPGLSADAADLLSSLGLRTVVDLRTGAETQLARSALDELAAGGTLTMHVSLIGEDLTEFLELGAIYDYFIDKRGVAIGAAVRSLARPGGLPALVHCTAGKDRTGIVVALVLAAMGVPDDVIAADYALTSLYLDLGRTPAIGRVLAGSGLGEELTEAMLVSPPELILATLNRARARAGSIGSYLTGCGVSADDLRALRSALVARG